MTLKIDPARGWPLAPTGIMVRAQDSEGVWQSADIWTLEADSLAEWLRSRGGRNAFAENVVGMLLGHSQIVTEQDGEENGG